MPVAQGQARQQAEREGDHQREVRVVGDGQDHRRERHRDQLGVPGLHGQQPDQADRRDDQAAERGDPRRGRRRSAARGGGRSSRSGRTGPPPARPPTPPRRSRAPRPSAALAGLVLHAEQDQLLLGDLLVLLDQHVAAAVGVVDVARRGRAACSRCWVGGQLLVGQRGGAGELLGDQAEEDLAELGGREGGDEVLRRPGRRAWRPARAGPGRGAPRCAASGAWPGARTASRSGWPPRGGAGRRARARRRGPGGRTPRSICAVQVVAALGGVGRLLQVVEGRRVELPGLARAPRAGRPGRAPWRSRRPGRRAARRSSRIGAGSLTIDGGDLVGLGLALGVGLDQVLAAGTPGR